MAVFQGMPPLMVPRPALGAAVLFHAGEKAYTVDDIVAFAMFTGMLDAAIDDTLRLAAAEERAAEVGFEPGDDALQESSEAFRYEHDLISAGETEQWLESRGMTLDDFTDYLYQRSCAEKFPDTEEVSPPDDLSDLLRVNLWMTDRLADLATALRRRVASGIEVQVTQVPLRGAADTMSRFLARHKLDAASLPGWLAWLQRDSKWFGEMVRIETASRQLGRSAINDDARQRKLPSMRMALTRIEVEMLVLDSEPAAREAVLCVTQDHESLTDVAVEIGYQASKATAWMDDLPSNVAAQLQAAADGQVIGPIGEGGHFEIYQVLRKIDPDLGDPDVSGRIDRSIADEFFDDLCARHTRAADLTVIQ
jgi:hypothetical protein